jgi:amino-acid N-acetyltransferase
MESAMHIRPARAEDFEAVTALLRAHQLPLDGIASPLEGFLVADDDGRIAGVVGLERYGDDGLLRSAAVDEGRRGNGVGRRLIERLLADAARDRVTSVYLLTTTAEQYFPRFGFEIVRRETIPEPVRQSVEFAKSCPASATAMMRRLAGT